MGGRTLTVILLFSILYMINHLIHKMKHKDLIYEIVTAVVLFALTLLLPALGVTNTTVLNANVFALIATLLLIGVRIYFFVQKSDIENSINELMNKFSEKAGKIINPMFSRFSKMTGEEFLAANKIINEAAAEVEKIEHGIIPLSKSDYFENIIRESDTISNNEIYAINTIDEQRFLYDPPEEKYFESNKKAIKDRNVKIHRIFIFNDEESDTDIKKKRLKAIKANFDAGVDVSIVYGSVLRREKITRGAYHDAVMFGKDSSKLYLDYQDADDDTRISHGELVKNHSAIENFWSDFNKLKILAIDEEQKIQEFATINGVSK